MQSEWSLYLNRFHSERPGITERVLARCRSDGMDPYRWCAQALDVASGPTLDIGCGSAPMAGRVTGWIGVDRSASELGEARGRRRWPLVRAEATSLPVATDATPAVVCSMAMQLIEPLSQALAEAARVLPPGGRAVLLLPATGPLSWRQAAGYLRLQAVLGRRIRYPNDRALRPRMLAATAAGCGLAVVSDERRAFALPVRSGAEADELLHSLYLPGVGPRRLRRARRVVARRVGTARVVPLRRVVLDRRSE
ncbi:MAG: class I SAM-dependent methyltransferase [Acidimicrobiales bacterium]